jgi:hypothetical protein
MKREYYRYLCFRSKDPFRLDSLLKYHSANLIDGPLFSLVMTCMYSCIVKGRIFAYDRKPKIYYSPRQRTLPVLESRNCKLLIPNHCSGISSAELFAFRVPTMCLGFSICGLCVCRLHVCGLHFCEFFVRGSIQCWSSTVPDSMVCECLIGSRISQRLSLINC